ncbi:ABC transporter substrate-binding protein [Clostridium ganghwense]|uniref:ABC transporter substrate-binding protein n=1 Tax=Clostridium ganghwense TaxID=312089 RepID=A0ABT4CRH9_9CLOT|nr:ABC transporter substrate-binding protein [Clostridium ganghwense]MCY6370681.1 ABC transporter substrate-binding protein [Clostridium ganghwense]
MKKLKFLPVLLVIVCFLATGCSSKQASTTASDKLEDVDVVLDWYPNAIHSFIYAAIEKGYFKEEGLNVNIKFPSNPTDPLSLPAAGKATVGIYYQPDIVMARVNEKIPVKCIGSITKTPLNVVISLKDKNINTPKELSGKTIGFSGNPLNVEYVKTMVEADGGDPNSLKIIDVGFELLSSMVTKKVDATTGGLINHEVPVLIHQGKKINYFDPSQYGVPNYYEEAFVTSETTLKEKPETLKKFMKACQKGFNFMKENPDKALKILLANQQKDNFPLVEEVEKQSMDILLPKMETKDKPFLKQEKKVWEDNINWLYKRGLIKEKPKAEDCYANLLD